MGRRDHQLDRKLNEKALPSPQSTTLPPTRPFTSEAAEPQITPEPSSSFDFSRVAVTQRDPGIASSRPLLQAKLTLGQPGDVYEQEADAVARQVVQRLNRPQTAPTTAAPSDPAWRHTEEPAFSVQRQSSIPVGPASPEFEQDLNRARGGGGSMDATVQAQMESAMGADFSQVKIHTGPQADQLSQSIQAKAFTTGNDVFFRQGAYAPNSPGGQELLAHELTHVVQQQPSTVAPRSMVHRALIQRDELNGRPDPFSWTNSSFKSATNAGWLSTRGGYLTTIDTWLKAVDTARTWDEQQHALQQVREACNAWLDKHNTTPQRGERSSVASRRSSILNLCQAATSAISSGGSLPSPTAPSNGGGRQVSHGKRVYEGALGLSESVAGTGGSAGDFDDARATDNNGQGSGMGDKVKSDFLDGANIVGGITDIYDAYNDYEGSTRKKIEAVSKGGEGVGKVAHGGMKVGRGIATEIDGDKVTTGWKGTGELGATIGDSTAALSGLVVTVNGLISLKKDWQASTTNEKIAQTLDIAESAASTTQGGIKTGLGIYKSGMEFAGNTPWADTVSAVGSAAAIAGLVAGAIQIAQGGFAIYRGLSANSNIKQAEQQQRAMIDGIATRLNDAAEGLNWMIAARKMGSEAVTEADLDAVEQELVTLQATLTELQHAEAQYAPAMAAMKKISNRRMEEGAMKAAGGGLAVVSSALTLSGVGAPIALAIGALAGIMALGYAGLSLARNAKANALTTVAKRLTDDGKPKAKPDPDPSYREMEKRVYKCYYGHIPEVMETRKPAGLKTDDFKIVKEFAWEDKKSRVKSLDKHIVSRPAEARNLDDRILENKWIEARNSAGKPTHKEKPKGWSKFNYKVSASAHKSKQATKASKEEVASALAALCLHSYDPNQASFVNAAIVPQGNADDETRQAVESYGNVTLTGLLSAADITAARWTKWCQKAQTAGKDPYDKSSGDTLAFMKDKIQSHI